MAERLTTTWTLAPAAQDYPPQAEPVAEEAGRLVPFRFLRPPLDRQLTQALEQGPMGLFWVNIGGYALFERLYGQDLSLEVVAKFRSILGRQLSEHMPELSYSAIEKAEGAAFIMLVQDGPTDLNKLADQATRLRLAVRQALNQEVVQFTGQQLRVEMGHALLQGLTGDLRHQLYNAINDARRVAEGSLSAGRLPMMEEFRRILDQKGLYSVYQPIVDLRNGEVLGWEALARGPAGSSFESPAIMFDFAEEVGSIFKLERCCREAAFRGLGQLDAGQKLFLNLHPQTMGDPGFRSGETLRLLESNGLTPRNVVFEITERHSIKDFTLFHRTLDHYRSQGYQVAVDDAGTGYSGLSRLALVRPDFIKVDMSLVRGVDTNPVQRALLETLVTFADKIGCHIICEGIETETELSSLISMGVHYGQGYFLARPATPKPMPQLDLVLRQEMRRRGLGDWKCSLPISNLVEVAPTVPPWELTREVKHLLDSQPISGAVVVDGRRPVGLVMSHSLDRQLGTYFGSSLYYERSIDRLMDTNPLIVEGSTPVQTVAERAMRRERFKLYDHIIVINQGDLLGLVSVQKMLDALAKVQVEVAKGANPLTGLPGNVALEQEIEKRCDEGRPTAYIYADLDNFKVFNDVYGFESGDKMILLVARILSWAVTRHGLPETFVGHVGGDDFVIITEGDRVERICRGVTRCFARLVRHLYNPIDLEKGYIEGRDRSGQPGRFPLVSISLGIVESAGVCQAGLVSLRAAEMKKYAKSHPGNTWVRDRRGPLGAPGCEDGSSPQPMPPVPRPDSPSLPVEVGLEDHASGKIHPLHPSLHLDASLA